MSRICHKTLLVIGMSSTLAFSFVPLVKAQVEVTGGELTIDNAEIFQPITGDRIEVASPTTVVGTDERSVIYNGDYQLDRIQIETTQGPIPTTAIFQPSTLPTFDPAITNPGSPLNATNIAEGTRSGQFQGTLFFRSLTPNGGAVFNNIPTTLNFTVTAATNPTELGEVTEFRAENFILTEVGTSESPNATGVVVRRTPVTLVQYDLGNLDGSSTNGQATAESLQNLNLFVPAERYDIAREGIGFGYESLTLGFDDGVIFTPPGFNIDGSTIFDNGVIEDDFGLFNPPVTIIETFEQGDVVAVTTAREGVWQVTPILPIFILEGIFVFQNVPGGMWFDPPATDGFEYEMTPRDVPIGLASRVFPGMTGLNQAEDALFTAISGFPQGIDADDRFTVIVEGQVLGEFGPGDTLRFRDYAEVLGDRLIEDEGVRKFVITDINPSVDAANPVAFPLKLDFNTPTASFEMRAMQATASLPEPAQQISLETSSAQ